MTPVYLAPGPRHLTQAHAATGLMNHLGLKLALVALQLGDLATTLTVFALGGYEVNPLALALFHLMPPWAAIVVAKIATSLLILRLRTRRLILLAVIGYVCIVAWNLLVIGFATRPK